MCFSLPHALSLSLCINKYINKDRESIAWHFVIPIMHYQPVISHLAADYINKIFNNS